MNHETHFLSLPLIVGWFINSIIALSPLSLSLPAGGKYTLPSFFAFPFQMFYSKHSIKCIAFFIQQVYTNTDHTLSLPGCAETRNLSQAFTLPFLLANTFIHPTGESINRNTIHLDLWWLLFHSFNRLRMTRFQRKLLDLRGRQVQVLRTELLTFKFERSTFLAPRIKPSPEKFWEGEGTIR